MDIDDDKKHPEKCSRPLASGAVSSQRALTLMGILSLTVLLGSFVYSRSLFYVLAGYFCLNLAYSVKLKHIAIVDIFIVSSGFVLRLFAGSAVTGTELSMWIIIITFLLALFLAAAKRRDDVLLAARGEKTRKNIDGYNLEFINAVMVFMAGVIVVSYILYTVSAEVITRLDSPHLYLSSFFVVLGVVRYMQITFVEEQSGNPSRIILQDRFLQCTVLLWLFSFMGIVLI